MELTHEQEARLTELSNNLRKDLAELASILFGDELDASSLSEGSLAARSVMQISCNTEATVAFMRCLGIEKEEFEAMKDALKGEEG